MHGNWVVYFRTWSRRSLFSGRAVTCRCLWNSQRLLHVIPKFETKILRSDMFVQENLISAAPTLRNLRMVHKMSGSFIYRHHVEPRVKLYSPRRIITYSTQIHWCNQNYSYEFGCQAGEAHWWLLERSRDLSDPWTGFTQFTPLDEKAPDGYMWSGEEINEETAYIQARSSVARALEINGTACQAEGEAKVVRGKDSSWKMHENWVGSISSTPRIRNSKKPSRTHVRSWNSSRSWHAL